MTTQIIKVYCDDPTWMPNISKRLKQIFDLSNIQTSHYELVKNEIAIESAKKIHTQNFVNLSREFPGQTIRAYIRTEEAPFSEKCYWSFRNGSENLDDVLLGTL